MEVSKVEKQKPVEEAMEHLEIDSTTKATNNVKLSPPKEASSSDATSCISSGDTVSIIKESEMNTQVPSVGDQGMYYYGYYYPGLNGSGWDENGYFVGTNSLEVHPTVVQADGSYLCYVPGFENGYAYSPLMPGSVVGVDGQLVGQHLYYSSPVLSQPVHSPGVFTSPVAYGPQLVPTYTWDPSFYYMDGFHGSTVAVDKTTTSSKPKYLSNNRNTITSSKASRNSKPTSVMKGSSSAVDLSNTPTGGNQSPKPTNKASGAEITDGYLSTTKLSLHSNQGQTGLLYSNKVVNLKENVRSWSNGDKLKEKRNLLGFGEYNLLNEKNNKTNSKKNGSSLADPVEPLRNVKNANKVPPAAAVSKDAYNLPDFCTKYDHALFFVIKSYSEDDIHKSIKYNVWASTPNGNKRLDNAYRVAQEKMAEKGTKCPVFLFFSVNASGQFCGVAEMAGPVDFNKNMDFWQQDKWNGFFPVKWHIMKDVPNPQFRHIILANNENKPVTNSRDTQEVNFPQGTEILGIFKNYSSKTSILDDFDFYENRQKAMQDRRSKPFTTTFEIPLSNADKPAEAKEGEFASTKLSIELGDNNTNQENSTFSDKDQ